MSGYTRQSAADIVDGNTINAAPLNNEFNAIQSFADGGSGHVHDGTTGNGPKIPLTTSVTGILPAANGGTGLSTNILATANTWTAKQTYSVASDLYHGTNIIGTTSGTGPSLLNFKSSNGTTLGTVGAATTDGDTYLTSASGRVNLYVVNTIRLQATTSGVAIAGALSSTGDFIAGGNITSSSGVFTGNGSGLTTLNASNLSSGTLPAARFDDTAHGTRGGGTLHPSATTSVNGFMSSTDKSKLDGIEAGATADMTASEILTAVKTVDGAGSGLDADLLDGQHGSYYQDAANLNAGILPAARFNDTSHGNRSGGNLHSVATIAVPGFMPANDKKKLDSGTLASFRNKIINGDFPITQRGTSQTSSGYGSDDRWFNGHAAGSTKTSSIILFVAGQTDVPNNPVAFSRTNISASTGIATYVQKFQAIEGVATLAGQTATLTFWAKASAALNMTFMFTQIFGTGGSTAVDGIESTKVSLSTSWQKYSYVVNIPTISGKTVGSADCLRLVFFMSAGSNFDSLTNSLGLQTGSIDLARVSLVPGNATDEDDPFSPRHIQQELALCQRYYEKSFPIKVDPGTATLNGSTAVPAGLAGLWECTITYKERKRDLPSVAVYSPSTGTIGYVRNASAGTDIGGTTTAGNGDTCTILYNTSFPAASHIGVVQWTSDAEL